MGPGARSVLVEQTEEGHFEVFIGIPADLPTGHWTLLARPTERLIASATIEVAGAPVDAEVGGQGLRDEDDPLLVPLPSGWQASRSNPPARRHQATGGRAVGCRRPGPDRLRSRRRSAHRPCSSIRTRGSGRADGVDDPQLTRDGRRSGWAAPFRLGLASEA